MMLTAICIVVVLVSPLVIGAPIRCLLSRGRPLGELDWIEVPFLGIAFIVLVHQALLDLGVSLRTALPFTWTAVVVLWIAAALLGKIAPFLRAFPRLAFAGFLGVYLLHGAGLFRAGVDDYYGWAWCDQAYYTMRAESLIEKPDQTSVEAMGQRPYLALGWIARAERRVGQTILQAFFSRSAGVEARLLFEPTILLGPALVFLGVMGVCRILGRSTPIAFVVGAASALLPGLAHVQLESFLSQSLAIPLLVILPALAWRTTNEQGADHVVVTGAVLAVGLSTYPEFLFFYLPAVAPFFAFTLASRKLRPLGRLFGALALGFLLTPVTCTALPGILRFATQPLFAGNIYPWALKPEGLTRIWFGDLIETPQYLVRSGMTAVAAVLTVAGYLGLGLALRPWRRSFSSDPDEPNVRPLVLTVLGLALIPLAIIARDTIHPYQFYKSLCTVAPLIALGLAFVVPQGRSDRSRLRMVLPAIALIAATPGTTMMALRAAQAPAGSRSAADILRSPAWKNLRRFLSSTSGKSFVYWSDADQWAPGYRNAWFSYFARKNQVWLCRPYVSDYDLSGRPGVERFFDLGSLPSDVTFVADNESAFLRPPPKESSKRVEWTDGSHTMWSPTGSEWVSLANVVSHSEVEEKGNFFWLSAEDADTVLEILAGAPGVARIHASFVIGPSLPRSSQVRLQLSAGAFHEQILVGSGPGAIEVPVSKGLNRIRVRPIAPKGSWPATNYPPPLLLVSGIHVEMGGTSTRDPK